MTQDYDSPPMGPFELVEITDAGPSTIATVRTYGWAAQLVALLNAMLKDEGRRFAFISRKPSEKGGTAG